MSRRAPFAGSVLPPQCGQLRLPSLRDRARNSLLAAHFLDRISHEHGRKFTFSDEALRTMMRHWPARARAREFHRTGCALAPTLLQLGACHAIAAKGLEARHAAAVRSTAWQLPRCRAEDAGRAGATPFWRIRTLNGTSAGRQLLASARHALSQAEEYASRPAARE